MKNWSLWQRRIAILVLLVLVVIGGGSLSILLLIGFPHSFALLFSAVLTVEATCVLWFGWQLRDVIQKRISDSRHKLDQLYWRGAISMSAFIGLLLVMRLWLPTGIWYQTTAIVLMSLLLLYALFYLLAALCLRQEGEGHLAFGFTERWFARFAFSLVIICSLGVLSLVNFLGGIFWWYRQYVTQDRRVEVVQRNQLLKSIQLTALFDRHRRYLGLHTKTESDWSRHYNDPNIMSWTVSRVIDLAEGQVIKPAWWWRYLPDGDKLLCEPFSIEAFIKVPYYFIKQQRKVGGSTPTLQAAKNFMDFGAARLGQGMLTTVRTKLFDEMPRAYIMCQSFSPREMMAIYQATLWAGQSANYGLHRLALYFYNKDELPTLDWNEATVLVASLPNPGRLNPWYLESCRLGKCENQTKAKVYDVWLRRIKQLKAGLRQRGVSVSEALPAFSNGLARLQAISHKWKNHDIHLRQWISGLMPEEVKDWDRGSRIYLHYDRALTVGDNNKPGLIDAVRQTIHSYREQLDDLQLSFSLVDARTGHITSQYGGDGDVDMALAHKPVVGSMFKVITLLVGNYWPDTLPIINRGQKNKNSRYFIYQSTNRQTGHVVRNSAAMPEYVDKLQALTISANIAFVFFSLRWTWFVPPVQWLEILHIGLAQMYEDKFQLSPEQARAKAQHLISNPEELRLDLIRHFGYQRHLQNLREHSAYEAAKTATINNLLHDPSISDKRQLTDLLAADNDSELLNMLPEIRTYFENQRQIYASRYKEGGINLEIMSWNRAFRMEIGLRYLIHLATKIADFDRKKNNLQPVMTLTLGVNDAQTHQLAAIASFLAHRQYSPPVLIQSILRGEHNLTPPAKPERETLPVPIQSIDFVRKAMSEVLRIGTAKSSGHILVAQYGAEILEQSGAKTGTVQKTRGISCLGFIGHRAGAITLSTPTNETLTTFRIRRSLLRNQANYQKQFSLLQTRYQKAAPGSARARRARQFAQQYQIRLSQVERIISEAKQIGKQYHQARKSYKENLKQANKALKRSRKAERNRQRLQRTNQSLQRKAGRYQRDINTLRRNQTYSALRLQSELYQAQQKSLQQGATFSDRVKALNRSQLRGLQYYQNSERRLRRRYNDLRQRIERNRQRITKETSIRTTEARRHREQMQSYRENFAEFRRLSRPFHRAYEQWTLSSANACRILFTLLSHWKNWEEKIEPPPVFSPITPSSQPSNAHSTPLARPSSDDPISTHPSSHPAIPAAIPSTGLGSNISDAGQPTEPSSHIPDNTPKPAKDHILLPVAPSPIPSLHSLPKTTSPKPPSERKPQSLPPPPEIISE
jgi:hypothetical protein